MATALARGFVRYGGAPALVAAAFLLRQKISAAAGPLPLYITFVPVLLVAALLWRMRAGLLAASVTTLFSTVK